MGIRDELKQRVHRAARNHRMNPDPDTDRTKPPSTVERRALEEISRLDARIAELEARGRRLRAAVTMARDAFSRYADLHRSKRTAPGDRKAAANTDLANAMAAALANLPPEALAQGGP